jgi:hypothetical protein
LLALVRKIADHLRRRGWIRSKKSYAILRQRLPLSRASAIGCGAERGSCRRRASASKSSWCGGRDAFASGAFRGPSPTSRLNAPTARSSARRGASPAKGAPNANA